MGKSTLATIIFLFSASAYQVAGSTQRMESSLTHAVVLTGTDKVLANPLGSTFFKQTYAAVQKKQWTDLAEADYQQLLKYSKGRNVAVKNYGHKTFNQVIRYTKNIKIQEDDSLSVSYKEINTILKKYE